jgi:hypothetical protein
MSNEHDTDYGGEMSPEQSLWTSVVQFTLFDALAGRKKTNPAHVTFDERRSIYLIEDSPPDFFLICQMAGINPFWIKRLYDDVIAGRREISKKRPKASTSHADGPKRRLRNEDGELIKRGYARH